MSDSSSPIYFPADDYRDSLISHLQTAFSGILASSTIKPELDESVGRDVAGISVASQDLGDHRGSVGRKLVDIQLNVSVYTHLNEDSDGTKLKTMCETMTSAVASWTPSISGWHTAYISGIQASQPTISNSVLRLSDFKLTLYLQNLN